MTPLIQPALQGLPIASALPAEALEAAEPGCFHLPGDDPAAEDADDAFAAFGAEGGGGDPVARYIDGLTGLTSDLAQARPASQPAATPPGRPAVSDRIVEQGSVDDHAAPLPHTAVATLVHRSARVSLPPDLPATLSGNPETRTPSDTPPSLLAAAAAPADARAPRRDASAAMAARPMPLTAAPVSAARAVATASSAPAGDPQSDPASPIVVNGPGTVPAPGTAPHTLLLPIASGPHRTSPGSGNFTESLATSGTAEHLITDRGAPPAMLGARAVAGNDPLSDPVSTGKTSLDAVRHGEVGDSRRAPERSGSAIPIRAPDPARTGSLPIGGMPAPVAEVQEASNEPPPELPDPVPTASVSLAAPAAPQAAPGQTVARQIAEAVLATREGTVDLTLSPEELGRVRIVVTETDQARHVTVWFDRAETGDAARRHADALSRDLADAGFAGATLDFRDHPSRHAEAAAATLAADADPDAIGVGSTAAPARPGGVARGDRHVDIRY